MGCCWFVFWMEGRVRCVDCVCATEPPRSSDNRVGDAGAASLAQALEKNTTLQTLNLGSEFVVLCLCLWRGADCCFMLLWAVVGLCF